MSVGVCKKIARGNNILCYSRVKITVVDKNRNVSKMGSRFIYLSPMTMTFNYY
jgi:hypothetical protein